MLVQLIKVGERHPRFLVTIKKANGSLRRIKIQATDRLAVIVIKQNATIPLNITHYNALDRDGFTQDCADDVVCLGFFLSGYYTIGWLSRCSSRRIASGFLLGRRGLNR